MKLSKSFFVGSFGRLGDSFDSLLGADVRRTAVSENGWFTDEGIRFAASAIREQMLDRTKIEAWLGAYDRLPVTEPKTVEVVAAGNIPLAGFFDVMCVLVSGHRCAVKYSSRDSVLMRKVTDFLATECSLPVAEASSGKPDALIASGGDASMAALDSSFSSVPRLLRGHRSSLAVLDGSETGDRLDRLADDVFLHCGMGCRNVSLIFVPRGFDIGRLSAAFEGHTRSLSPKYRHNYLQTRALLAMSHADMVDADGFMFCFDRDFPSALSRINVSFYDSVDEVSAWLAKNDDRIQCVVSEAVEYPRRCGFGMAQKPSLTDYPDGKDTMRFLSEMAR